MYSDCRCVGLNLHVFSTRSKRILVIIKVDTALLKLASYFTIYSEATLQSMSVSNHQPHEIFYGVTFMNRRECLRLAQRTCTCRVMVIKLPLMTDWEVINPVFHLLFPPPFS